MTKVSPGGTRLLSLGRRTGARREEDGDERSWFGVKVLIETRVECDVEPLHEERVIEERILLVEALGVDEVIAARGTAW